MATIAVTFSGAIQAQPVGKMASPSPVSKPSPAKQPAKSPPVKQSVTDIPPWKLTGNELLLELSSQSINFSSGLYALTPPFPGDKVPIRASDIKLTLLATGGQRPAWSPHHKIFAYVAGGRIWVGNPTGLTRPLAPTLPDQATPAGEPPMRWGWAGFAYGISSPQSWGSKVTIGGVREDFSVDQVHYGAMWQEAFGIEILPLAAVPGEGKDPAWRDILTTNQPSFSPDGRRMAAEVYPAGPHDLNRLKSRIKVFEYYPWTGPNAKQRYSEETSIEDLRAGSASYYFVSSVPTFLPKFAELIPDESSDAQLRPRWSPDGRWIAFNRFSNENQSMEPYVFDTEAPGSAPTNLSVGREYGTKDSPTTLAWGKLNSEILDWSSNGRLWIVDGRRTELRSAVLSGGQWKVAVAGGALTNGFGMDHMAFRDDLAAFTVDADFPKGRINIVNATTGETSVLDLPPGLTIRSMAW